MIGIKNIIRQKQDNTRVVKRIKPLVTKMEQKKIDMAEADKALPSLSKMRSIAIKSNRASGYTKKDPMKYFRAYKLYLEKRGIKK